VLRSVGRSKGAPLIPAGARVRGDLDEAVFVTALPAEARVTSAACASREEIRSWFGRLAALPPPADVAAALWSLGKAIDAHGLAPEAIERFEHPVDLDPSALRPWIEALHRRASQREREDTAWRSELDLARRATEWIVMATSALLAPGALSSLFAEPIEGAAGEAFYLRAALHGYKFIGDLPLSAALRDRAARILIARALGAMFVELEPDDPACAEPLALVEAMLRGHGLEAYAHDLPS
jgi:lysine-N-methylase